MPGVLFIPINLNEINFEKNGLNMIVETNYNPFKIYMNG